MKLYESNTEFLTCPEQTEESNLQDSLILLPGATPGYTTEGIMRNKKVRKIWV